MIKGERGRDEDAGEDIQDNSGTKMATAPATGRPLASRPRDRREGPPATQQVRGGGGPLLQQDDHRRDGPETTKPTSASTTAGLAR